VFRQLGAANWWYLLRDLGCCLCVCLWHAKHYSMLSCPVLPTLQHCTCVRTLQYCTRLRLHTLSGAMRESVNDPCIL
jgi:hypothetical protein